MIEREQNLEGGIRYEEVVNIGGQSWCGTRGGCETGVHKGRDHKTVCAYACVCYGEIHTWMKQTSIEIIKQIFLEFGGSE